MKPDKPKTGTTILASSISLMISLPLAILVGGFAGWAAGSAAGEWLEYAGVHDALSWGGRIGRLLGAVLCPSIVLWKLTRKKPNGGEEVPEERSRNPS